MCPAKVKHKRRLKAIRHWPAQYYLYLIIFIYYIPDCYCHLVEQFESIWKALPDICSIAGLILSVFGGFVFHGRAFYRWTALILNAIALVLSEIFRFCLYNSVQNDWLFFALTFSMLSYAVYPPVLSRKVSPFFRYVLLFISILSFMTETIFIL